MEENVEEIQMDLPPSPIEAEGGIGPPWPNMGDDSFLVLPGKGNAEGGKGFGPVGPCLLYTSDAADDM
eukprot:2081991-Karenia_brevis.AAC.1